MESASTRLPDHIYHAYCEYKRRQRALIVWLIDNCGSSDRLRLRQEHAPEYRLPISDVERLADMVVKRRVVVPDFMLYVCQSMLRLRREVAYYYVGDDDGHEWCIQRYDRIVQKLESLRTPTLRSVDVGNVAEVVPDNASRNSYAVLPASEHVASSIHGAPLLARNLNVSPKRPRTVRKPAEDNPSTKFRANGAAALYIQVLCASNRAHQVCDRAGQGKLPLIIATYMTERVQVWIARCWVGITQKCDTRWLQGRSEQKTDDIVPGLKAFQRAISGREEDAGTQKLESVLSGPSENLKLSVTDMQHATPVIALLVGDQAVWTDIDEPLELVQSFRRNIHDESQRRQALIPFKRQTTYERDLPDPRHADDWGHYILHLLQDLEHHEFQKESNEGKQPKLMPQLPQHNRLLLMLSRMMRQNVPAWQLLAFGYSTALLRKFAQCFFFGYDVAVGRTLADGSNVRASNSNYRLKALSFVQEVQQTLKEFGSSATLPITSTRTRANVIVLSFELGEYLRNNRFDLLTQHPLIAGGDMMFVVDFVYSLGIQVLAFRVAFLGVLHVYNAFRQLKIIDHSMPVLDALCETLLSPAFFGKLPKSKFLKLWELLDDPSHTDQISAQEYRNTKNGMKWLNGSS